MILLTLTSDIGAHDYLVGAVKGRLLSVNQEFSIVDISHQLSPFNHSQAAYICRNVLQNFPSFTFHIILVNLFEKKPEQILLAFHKEQYIFCADNGLLSMIVDGKPELVIGIPLDKKVEKNTINFAAAIGNAINDISRGKSLMDIGQPDVEYIEKNHLRPYFDEGWMEGQIIFIDHFENVTVNITRPEFERQRRGRRFRIVFKRDEVIDSISETYADVPEGEKLALFNSGGYLEIAINKGNAAGLFGLQDFTEQSQNQYLQGKLFYQTVKVYFDDENE